MNVFNSIGSNYDLRFAWKALVVGSNPGYSEQLKKYLENRYGGEVVLTYKGREALELAMKNLSLPPGSKVGINGFTCYVVYKAVANAGYKPIYLYINDRNLNFSPSTLISDIRCLILQNTLGYPCNMTEIEKFCKERNIPLIEDLAHSVGTKYQDEREAGNVGDFVMLSFGKSKIIDGVSGGALITRNKNYQDRNVRLEKVGIGQQLMDRVYPIFTYFIIATYKIGIGKLIHAVLRESGALPTPMGKDTGELHSLPHWYSKLAHEAFLRLESDLKHRKEISKIYASNINPEILSDTARRYIEHSTNVRFPIFIKNRDSLINYLKKYGAYVSGIWYDAPIAPPSHMSLTDYQIGTCPESEKISSQILNLPTHQNVSAKDAEEIAIKINQWIKLQ